MKIAVLMPKFPVTSETFIINQINGLIRRGHDVEILTFYEPKNGTIAHDSIQKYNLEDKVYCIGGIPRSKKQRIKKAFLLLIKNGRSTKIKNIFESLNVFKYGRSVLSLRSFFAYLQIENKKKYDIIHCQYGQYGVDALILKKLNLLYGKIITSFRGADITQALKPNKKGYVKLFNDTSLFLPVCEYFKNILIEMGCPKQKIIVHYSGIDVTKFTYSKHGNLNSKFHIVSTARLEEKKGLYYAIEAVASFVKNDSNILYTIIGEGKLKHDLARQIKKNKVEKYVKLVGNKNHDQVLEYLNNADLLLAPSITSKTGDKEGIPNAIKEAMLMKVPVISTFHSGIPELIIDNETGYLVPEKDIKAIYNKLLFVKNNKSYQLKISADAAKHVRKNYSTKTLNNKLEKIYINIINS